MTLSVILAGRYDAAWTEGDNLACIATDSIKDIVNVTAARNLFLDPEAFVAAAAQVLLETHPRVEPVTIEVGEMRWLRHSVDGIPHGHTFTRDGNGAGYAGPVVSSGLRGFSFMKTTQSGWSGFAADGYRTLPDTTDRIAATRMDATRTLWSAPSDYEGATALILSTLLTTFAARSSRGVQASLYRMGDAALAAVPELTEHALGDD